jgi:hypothetical protein
VKESTITVKMIGEPNNNLSHVGFHSAGHDTFRGIHAKEIDELYTFLTTIPLFSDII